MADDFIRQYLHYTSDTEVPVSFCRWSAIGGIGALLEKSIWLSHGHMRIFPNQYLMLMGTAGTRKGTSIKLMKKVLSDIGVGNFSAERTSKEKFLLDLSGDTDDEGSSFLDSKFGIGDSQVHPMNIFVDEANDFFGHGNMDFLSIIGNLWDWDGPPYRNRIKTGKSVSVSEPIVSILAGNTPTGFSTAFPPEIIGQGFFSRLLLVYSEPNGKKITFPRSPAPEETKLISTLLQQIKMYHYGEVGISDTAKQLLDLIYKKTVPINDLRFDSYFNRRFTHLLKMCLICAANGMKKEVGEDEVIEANTYLSYVESLMPKALGEFGKSKNSDVAHKILTYIESQDGCKLKDIMKLVSNDLEKPSDIGDIIKKLSISDKIQAVNGIFLPMRKIGITDSSGMIDLSYLTEEELRVKG